VGGLDSIRQQRHRLDEAGSPLLRLLPDYQRQFREHLLQANARHEASQQRCVYVRVHVCPTHVMLFADLTLRWIACGC
jgi:hypothetical protein